MYSQVLIKQVGPNKRLGWIFYVILNKQALIKEQDLRRVGKQAYYQWNSSKQGLKNKQDGKFANLKMLIKQTRIFGTYEYIVKSQNRLLAFKITKCYKEKEGNKEEKSSSYGELNPCFQHGGSKCLFIQPLELIKQKRALYLYHSMA